MSDVSDYKARVSAEGVDETLAQLRNFAQQVTSIIKGQQQTIQSGLTSPFATATKQATQLNRSADRELKQGTKASFDQALTAVAGFTTGLTGIGMKFGALEIGKKVREAAELFSGLQDAMIRINAVANLTAEEQRKLRDMLIDTSKRVNLSAAALGAHYAEFSARSGRSAAENLETFPQIVKFARNANVEIGTAMRLISEAQASLNIGAQDIPGVLDTTLKVIGPATERFDRFFARIGPQMRTWGVNTKEGYNSLLTLYAAITQQFRGEGTKRLADAHIIKLLEAAQDPESPIGRMIYRQVVAARGNQLEILKIAENYIRSTGAYGTDESAAYARRRLGLDVRDVAIGKAGVDEGAVARITKQIAESEGENARRNEQWSNTLSGEWNALTGTLSGWINRITEGVLGGSENPLLGPEGPPSVVRLAPRAPGGARARFQHGGVIGGGGQISALPSGGGGPASRDNTAATSDNTEATKRLTRVLEPLADRRGTLAAAFAGALGEGAGGLGGIGGTGLAGTPSGEAGRGAPGGYGGRPGGRPGGPGSYGPSVPAAPAALKFPTSVEQGPESIAEAVKRGFMRSPRGGGGNANLTPEGMAWMDMIAKREAEPAFTKEGQRAGWNTMVGGARFDASTMEHPHRAYPGMRGFVGGAGVSYASGRYQETTATYYENVARSQELHPGVEVRGWSPEAQNIRNWDKAQDVYARNYRSLAIPGLTGNLQKDLEANKRNPDVLGRMSRTMHGEWTSAPGGREGAKVTGGRESAYAAAFQQYYNPKEQIAGAGAGGEGRIVPGEIRTADIAAVRGEPAVAGVAAGSDLEYLAAHGAHSTVAGKSVPLGTIPVDPEFAARLAAAGKAYNAETGHEPMFSEVSRDYATQAHYRWLVEHGSGGLAARPGTSRHEVTKEHAGQATDLPAGPFRDWMERNRPKYGIEGIGPRDRPHQQLARSYRGPAFHHPEQQKAAAAPAAAEKASPAAAQVSDASRMAEGGIVKANQGGVVPLPRERPTDAAIGWQRLHDQLVKEPATARLLSYGEGDPLPGGTNLFGEKHIEHLKDAEKEMEASKGEHRDVGPRSYAYPKEYKFDPRSGQPIGQPIRYEMTPAIPRAAIGRQAAHAYNNHVLDLATIQSGADNWVV